MYLKKLQILNFRCIKDLTLEFTKGVNVIIGENDSGKSAIVDAMRLCFSFGNKRREIYVRQEDFYINRSTLEQNFDDIEFHLEFEGDQESDGDFHELLVCSGGNTPKFELHFRYYIDKADTGGNRVKYDYWGNKTEGGKIDYRIFDYFNCVYLGALRDATTDLMPYKSGILGDMFKRIKSDETEQDELAQRLRNNLNSDPDWTDLRDTGKEKVNTHLKRSLLKGDDTDVSIDFLPFTFNRLVNNLIVQLPVRKTVNGDEREYVFDLQQNGLGTNNLIYTSVVLGDLNIRKRDDGGSYNTLLIEEPEAHLHPQLQTNFFTYLNELNRDIGFQVFVTSHSPTITSKGSLDSLIVLQTVDGVIKSTNLNNVSISEVNKEYLHKFLDVTKSQLFFSKGVMLVEGISEQLLMPLFFNKHFAEDYALEKRGIEVVNLGGVAFEHFGKLFNDPDEKKRLKMRCSIVTDSDTYVVQEPITRISNIVEMQGGLLNAFFAKGTFEYELIKAGANAKLLLDVLSKIHPQAGGALMEQCPPDQEISEESAKRFVEILDDNKTKSRFAHELAIKLNNDPYLLDQFTVPTYLINAINWVENGEL